MPSQLISVIEYWNLRKPVSQFSFLVVIAERIIRVESRERVWFQPRTQDVVLFNRKYEKQVAEGI